MADNGNSVLDGLYLLAKSLPNKKAQAKAYILAIIGNVTAAASVAWADITDKPLVFPPDTHTHVVADITDYVAGSLADGDYGDITVSGTGAVLTIDSAVVTEAKQILADNTTNNVSTTKHGYVPKAPNLTTQFLRGDGSWAVPPGGGAIVTTLTSGTIFYVPANWNNASNTIECYGGGGGGRSTDGGGGGGGAYSKISNLALTASSIVLYSVGAGGTAAGGTGGDTYFSSAAVVLAKGGAGATSRTGAAGGASASCVGDVKYSGGAGGNAPTGNPGGGGGGVAGPDGVGGVGAVSTVSVGGDGGRANNGVGPLGGLGYTASTTGGGGGGGGIFLVGNNSAGPGGKGGLFGGGGGGGGTVANSLGEAGGQGCIIVTYTPA